MSEEEDLGFWNKATFEALADNTPERCPNCDSQENFKLVKKKPQGSIQVIDLHILKHSCGWEKDITPWELA